MKNLLLIICLIVSGTIIANGQNYLGLSQSKIIKRFGDPDIKGVNYLVYFDQTEDGSNTYYFDENNTCNMFVITRTSNYLKDYTKLLIKDFTKTPKKYYVCKYKDLNLKAELTQSNNVFKISITYEDEDPRQLSENIVNN